MGDISACENVVVAVVGRRDADERYLQIARRIGEMLAKKGCTVLNGLAVGCDAKALEGAVVAKGKAVAVMLGAWMRFIRSRIKSWRSRLWRRAVVSSVSIPAARSRRGICLCRGTGFRRCFPTRF